MKGTELEIEHGAPASGTPAASTPRTERLVSLDALRGVCCRLAHSLLDVTQKGIHQELGAEPEFQVA